MIVNIVKQTSRSLSYSSIVVTIILLQTETMDLKWSLYFCFLNIFQPYSVHNERFVQPKT